MSSRTNKKHFVIFNNNGIISIATTKDWARGNQSLFSGYNFTNSKNTPTINIIEKYLISECNFTKITDDQVTICYEYNSI